MAEVVEAKRAERRTFEHLAVPLRERRAVEVAADDAAEDEVVLVGEVLPLAEPCERLCDSRASVAVSDQFAFNADGTAVRVIARVDVGVNDPDGLCVIKATAVAREGKSKS